MNDLETQPPAEAPAVAPATAQPVATKPQEPIAKPEAKPQPEAKPVAAKPSKKNLKGAPAFPPIQGPPPSISAEKQQRMDELLRKYRADQITPEEYHQQRAKILAEP
jgi:hypothetical protein